MEGTNVGKYQLRGRIGGGAVGVVYEGWDPILARKVAIKMLPLVETDNQSREKRSRFLREAQAAASLYHPNIVGIYDYGETDTSAYIIMELVEGESLDVRLEKTGQPSVAEVSAIMAGLLRGLQHSHERGVVHRDVKPGNILVMPDCRIKITDFGIAHLESSEMTRHGAVMGTPAYMSPEQVLGEQVDARTDIYSAGVVLYRMLLGRRPFDGSTLSVMHKIVNAPPDLPTDLLAAVSPRMGAVLAKSLAKRPEDRYRSAAELARALSEELGRRDGFFPPEENDSDQADRTVIVEPGAASPEAPPEAAKAEAAGIAPFAGPRRHGGSRVMLLSLAAFAVCTLLLGGLGWWALGPSRPAADAGGMRASPPTPAQPATATVGHARDEPVPLPPQGLPTEHKPLGGVGDPLLPDAPSAIAPVVRALDAAAAAIPCSLLSVRRVDQAGLTVGGLTALGDASELQIRATLRRVAASAAPGTPVTWGVRHVEGPYCGVFDVLRSARGLSDGLALPPMLSFAGQPARFVEGETAQVAVTAPGSSEALLLDFYAPDGSVTHLLPATRDAPEAHAPDKPVKAASGATGDPGLRVRVPRGMGVITLIVAPQNLLAQGRPMREAASGYVSELKMSLERERTRGARLAAEALVIAGQAQ